MPDPDSPTVTCALCSQEVGLERVTIVGAVPPEIADVSALDARQHICDACLGEARLRTLTQRLEAERGELTTLEEEVAKRTMTGGTIARQLGDDFVRGSTRAQRIADTVARVGGSWRFVIGALVVIMTWLVINTVIVPSRAFDPYPYILLNLVLSCLAALQAPIIMMSQNRAGMRDRMQADQDFLVNLKAELEINGLHAKIDHLLHERWENLLQLQRLQVDLISQLRKDVARDHAGPH